MNSVSGRARSQNKAT